MNLDMGGWVGGKLDFAIGIKQMFISARHWILTSVIFMKYIIEKQLG
jgi:hypothetical protein